MLERVKALLFGSGPAAEHDRDSDPAFAAAALMIEAAGLDGEVAAVERDRIAALLERGFGLPAAAARDMVTAAYGRMSDMQQLHPFARTIRDRLSQEERIGLVEMLWDVIYADARVHDYEANLMRRLGGLLYVSDIDVGAARKRVLARRRPAGAEGAGQREDKLG